MKNTRTYLGMVFLSISFIGNAQQKEQSLDTIVNPSNVLEEVVLSDTRLPIKLSNSGKTVVQISRKEIEEFSGRSLASLLSTKSGLVVLGNRSVTGQNLRVALRGSLNNQVLILVDGVRVSDPSRIGNDFDLNMLSLSDIDSIEILKGGASTLYGSAAAAGVIRITTRKNQDNRFNISLVGGTEQASNQSLKGVSYFSNALNYTHKKENWYYRFGVSSLSTDGMSSVVSGTETDAFFRYNLNGQVGYENKGLKVKLIASKSQIKSDYDNIFPLSDADFYGFSFLENIAFNSEYSYNKGTLSFQGGMQKTRREYRDNYPSTYLANNRSVEVMNKLQLTPRLYSIQGWLYQEAVYEGALPTHQNDVFTSLVYMGEKGFNFNGGIRMNQHQLYGNHFTYTFNPSFLIPLKTGSLKLISDVSSAFIAPSLFQLYDAYSGNPNLAPEESTSSEIGLVWALKEACSSLVYFQRNEDYKIIFDSTYAYANAAADFKVRGFEYTYRNRLFSLVDFNLNYTFTELEEGVLARLPKHAWNLDLNYRFQSNGIGLVYAYRGKRQAIDSSSLEAYSLVDLKYSKRFAKTNLELNAWLTNLFDEDYTELLGFATQGRNFRLGLNYRF